MTADSSLLESSHQLSFLQTVSQNFEFLANGAMCNSDRQFDDIKSSRFNFVTNCSRQSCMLAPDVHLINTSFLPLGG